RWMPRKIVPDMACHQASVDVGSARRGIADDEADCLALVKILDRLSLPRDRSGRRCRQEEQYRCCCAGRSQLGHRVSPEGIEDCCSFQSGTSIANPLAPTYT